jgi:hypothetical protein
MDLRERDFSCLRNLPNLQELLVSCDGHYWVQEDSLSCLSSLRHLTKLELSVLRHDIAARLPTSLVDLAISGEDQYSVQDLRRLTNLTRLQAYAMDGPKVLPTQLQELCLGYVQWSKEFLQMQQLCSLQIDLRRGETFVVPDLALLTAWTSLTALRVTSSRLEPYSGELSAVCMQLPSLPLVALQSSSDSFMAADIEHLGQCTQLTALHLDDARLRLSVEAFAEQLQKLQGLDCLSLDWVRYKPHPQGPDDLQPLVNAIRQLCGKRLREVSVSQVVLSGEQQSVLEGLLGSKFRYKEGQMRDSPVSSDYDSDDDMGGMGFGGHVLDVGGIDFNALVARILAAPLMGGNMHGGS